MDVNTALTIIGSLVSILLMVNAFFTRATLKEIIEVKLKLTEVAVKHDATEERSKNNYLKNEKLENELQRTKERLHTLEGDTRQLFELYKELTKE